MTRFYAGLDLGKSSDYTALIIAEQRNTEPVSYLTRHIQRFTLGTPYPHIVTDVRALLGAVPDCTLAIDATGVGAAVVDMFDEAGVPCEEWYAIFIHGGDNVTHAYNNYRVPKRDLVAVVQVLLQNRTLKFHDRLAHVQLLVRELQHFRVKIDPQTAHDSYTAWREEQHDDLVLAMALALWVAEQLPQHQPIAGTWGVR